jgi:hypothetical protein
MPERPSDPLVKLLAVAVALFGAVAIWLDFAEGWPLRMDGQWIGADFINMWVGARLGVAGDTATLFDWPRYVEFLRAVTEPDFPVKNWSYPPSVLLFVWPLAFLDHATGLALWYAAGFLAYALAVRSLARTYGIGLWSAPVWLALVAPAVTANIVMGQVGLFTAALFVGGMSLRERRPILAGLLFGLLTLKPHLGLVLPILLIVERRPAVFAAAAATAVSLVLATSLVFGFDVFPNYLREVGPTQFGILMSPQFTTMMPTPFVGIRSIGLPMEAGWIAAALTAPVALAAVVLAARRSGGTRAEGGPADEARRATDLIVAGSVYFLALYAFVYDMSMLAPFLAFALADPATTPRRRLLLVFTLLAPCYASSPIFGLALAVPAVLLVLMLDVLLGMWRAGRAVDGEGTRLSVARSG